MMERARLLFLSLKKSAKLEYLKRVKNHTDRLIYKRLVLSILIDDIPKIPRVEGCGDMHTKEWGQLPDP